MTTTKFLRSPVPLTASLLMAGLPLSGFAQAPAAAGGSAAPATVWQQCTALSDGPARLACFDQWAQQQSRQPLLSQQASPAATTPPASANAMQGLTPPAGALAVADIPAPIGGCRNDGYTEMSRFWELEAGTDCGTFSFRGYRPLSVSVAVGDKVNRQPSSLNPVNSATTETDYQRQEMRIQLSVRTKLAQNLLTDPNGKLRDSLWIGYTGLSYWQVFNSDLSRPFRTTDHQPEIFYIYPTTAQLPFGWRWRYSGIGLEHQSNGQSDPLSRSWNRTYLMTGFELDNRWQLQAKIWHRINESAEDDNNPNIQNYIGRSELKLGWNVNQRNWMGVTARGSLNGHGKGSGRVEWMHTLGDGWMGGKSNLRLHAQLFHGYGDSLIDYNYKRTVFSLGFSLLDF